MKPFVKHLLVFAAGMGLIAAATGALAASKEIKVSVVADKSISKIGAIGFSIPKIKKSHGGLGKSYTSSASMPAGAEYSFGYKTGALGSGKAVPCGSHVLNTNSIVKLSIDKKTGKCISTVITLKK